MTDKDWMILAEALRSEASARPQDYGIAEMARWGVLSSLATVADVMAKRVEIGVCHGPAHRTERDGGISYGLEHKGKYP